MSTATKFALSPNEGDSDFDAMLLMGVARHKNKVVRKALEFGTCCRRPSAYALYVYVYSGRLTP